MEQDVRMAALAVPILPHPGVSKSATALPDPIEDELKQAASSIRSLGIREFGFLPVDRKVPVERQAHGHGVPSRFDQLHRL
jgi:hypothetical protein